MLTSKVPAWLRELLGIIPTSHSFSHHAILSVPHRLAWSIDSTHAANRREKKQYSPDPLCIASRGPDFFGGSFRRHTLAGICGFEK
jgi:hypothetical protein